MTSFGWIIILVAIFVALLFIGFACMRGRDARIDGQTALNEFKKRSE